MEPPGYQKCKGFQRNTINRVGRSRPISIRLCGLWDQGLWIGGVPEKRTPIYYFCKLIQPTRAVRLEARRRRGLGVLHRAALTNWLILMPVLAQDPKAVYQQAVAQIQGGHPEAAVAILQPWINSQPNDLRALTLLGMALSGTGQIEKGNSFFTRALEIRPTYVPALRGFAMNELAMKQKDGAKTHFEQLLNVAPADPVAHAGMGELDFEQRNFAKAAEHFEQAGTACDQNPRLLFEYAKSLIELKDPAKAIAVLGRVPASADGQTHFEAGALLASIKAYKSAAQQFELAMPTYPDTYSAGYNLVLARTNAQQYPEAIAAGQGLISKGYRKSELYNLLSVAYEKAGNTKLAYDSLRTATQLEPQDESNYIDLITLCLDHKNNDLATEIATLGINRIPGSERLHLQLGVVYAMKEQFDDARKEFETAQKLNPARSLPHVALALVMLQTNRAAGAIDELRNRVQSAPNDYLALWFLGEAINRSGPAQGSPEQNEALGAAQRSVSINPEISQSQTLLGKLLAHEGKLDEAAIHLERAVALDPENAGAIYQLAQVYSRRGEADRAKPLFAKVSKMKVDDREKFATGLQQILRADSQ
jgi:tetratricopeptide (TPR) repeat protein